MKKYKVVNCGGRYNAELRRAFEMAVNFWLDRGWSPQGGVCVAVYPNGDVMLTQALVKEAE